MVTCRAQQMIVLKIEIEIILEVLVWIIQTASSHEINYPTSVAHETYFLALVAHV